MKEDKTSNRNTAKSRKQKKWKERFLSQEYPEFSSPVGYLKYKEMKAASAY